MRTYDPYVLELNAIDCETGLRMYFRIAEPRPSFPFVNTPKITWRLAASGLQELTD